MFKNCLLDATYKMFHIQVMGIRGKLQVYIVCGTEC